MDFLGRTPALRMALGKERNLNAWEPVNEQEAVQKFSALQVVMPGVSGIPPQLREAIAWAEAEKSKRGMN
jgi:hypothetical protein